MAIEESQSAWSRIWKREKWQLRSCSAVAETRTVNLCPRACICARLEEVLTRVLLSHRNCLFWFSAKKLMTQRAGLLSGLQCLQCWRCLVPRPEAEEATGPRFPGCSCAAALSFCIYLRTCRCSPISLGSTLCHCIFHYGRSRAPAH